MTKVTAAALYDYEGNSNLRIVEEMLSDGSKVYNVMIGTFEHPATSQKDAESIYATILNAIEK